MKKMTKGAIVTGLGVALLLGGGGTLATWKAQETASAGTITSGNLNVTTTDTTPWTSSAVGDIDDISKHWIIPGEKLTYAQAINIDLQGDHMQAVLSVDGLTNFDHGFNKSVDNVGNVQKTLTVESYTFTDPSGKEVEFDGNVSTNAIDGTYNVKVVLAFNAEDRIDVNKTLDLKDINYTLTQNQVG